MTHRLTYNSVNIDGLTLLPPGPRVNYIHVSKSNRSSSGKIETISQYGLVNLEFDAWFSITTYKSLVAFFSWARQGKVCSFALDSGETSNTTLDGAAASGQKVIPVTDGSSFSTYDVCFIQSLDGEKYEIFAVASHDAGQINSVTNLIYSYEIGSACRLLDYYPSLVYTGGQFNPTRTGMKDTSSDFYYQASFAFEEAP